jgi:hypothetical protein
MKLSTHRVAAIIVTGLISGWYRYYDYETWSRRGREAYISHRLEIFDKYIAHPRPLLFTLLTSVIGLALILGFYELIAAALAKLFPAQPAIVATAADPRGQSPTV